MEPKKPIHQHHNKQWLRYAGMSTQLIVLIGLAVWAGLWIDGKTQWRIPLFTITLPLIAIVQFLYRLIKDISKKDQE